MKRAMNFLMLSCKRSTELIEKKSDSGLNLMERLQLSMHMSMCSACSAWQKHSAEMDTALHHHSDPDQLSESNESLSDEAKSNILKNIRSAD